MAAPLLFDFVLETCNAPGTGTINLAGAPAGRRTFASVLASGQQAYYYMDDGTQAEWGYGTFTAGSPNTLARTGVFGNTAGTAVALNFTGTTRVYNELPSNRVQDGLNSEWTVLNVLAGTSSNSSIFAALPAGITRFAIDFEIATDHSVAATGPCVFTWSYNGGSSYVAGTSWQYSITDDATRVSSVGNNFAVLSGTYAGPFHGRIEWTQTQKIIRSNCASKDSGGMHASMGSATEPTAGTPNFFQIGNASGLLTAATRIRLLGALQ